jgi:hypothetical protein
MINIDLNYADWKSQVDTKELDHFNYKVKDIYFLIAIDGPLTFKCKLDLDDNSDYEANYLSNSNKKVGSFYQREPFASKLLKDGSKLYRRKHGYKETILANSNKEILINVPYANCKINKLEIIDGNALDRIDMMVLDTPTGTISATLEATGYTAIPDLMLNQFGDNVVISELLYSDKSDYDADLIQDMKVKIVYYNDTNADKEVGFNVIFHEVK